MLMLTVAATCSADFVSVVISVSTGASTSVTFSEFSESNTTSKCSTLRCLAAVMKISYTARFIVSPDSRETAIHWQRTQLSQDTHTSNELNQAKQEWAPNKRDTTGAHTWHQLTLPHAYDVRHSQALILSHERHDGCKALQSFKVQVKHFAVHALAQAHFKNLQQ